MSLTLKMDEAMFAQDVRRLSKLLRKDLGETLKGQGKLYVKDCILYTPPVVRGGIGESLSAQRRVGEKAIEKNIKRAYQSPEDIKILQNPKKGTLGHSINVLLRKKRYEEAESLMTRKANLRILGVANKAGKQYEQGRVRGRYRKTWSFFVTNPKSIKTLINVKKKRVGIGKHGWSKAAMALGINLPNWISRHTSRPSGIYNENLTGESPSIEVGNNVPYIQDSGKELQVMQKAMRSRAIKLQKQVEATVKAVFK